MFDCLVLWPKFPKVVSKYPTSLQITSGLRIRLRPYFDGALHFLIAILQLIVVIAYKERLVIFELAVLISVSLMLNICDSR